MSGTSPQADRGKTPPGGSHAVVIGASLTGLLAAWTLAGHMDKVTVIERDRLPENPEFRPGVPQARHAHGFMEGGQRALEELLPGILDEFVAAGATRTKLPSELLWLDYAGWNDRTLPGDGTFLSCTRPLLNWTVHQRVATHSRITFVEATTVTSLLHSGGAVTGVVTKAKGGEEEEQITADLVVDASGRGSAAPQWLEALGYPAPAEEVIDAGLAYATRLFHRPPGSDKNDFNVVMIQPVVSAPRFGLLLPVEGDRWLVAVCGVRGFEPPTDPEGWMDYVKSLRNPIIAEMLADAEPASPIFGFRNTQNRRRRYDRSARHPENFVVLGDAACTFNPIYGQGMSASCIQAVEFRKLVAKHGTGSGLARKAQKMAARTVRNPWEMATSEDRRHPTTTGGRAPGPVDKALDWYIKRVSAEALVNPVACEAFFGVVTLVEPPTTLFKPAVLLAALRRKGRHITAPEPVLAGRSTAGNTPS